MRTGMAARGYELYGSIAVIESEPAAAKAMARRLMSNNKNVKTVLRKGGAISGRYRTRKYVYVAGEKNYLVNYRENGCLFVFDIRKVYFSTKLAYERKRVSDAAKDNEQVIVMFAGVGPYAIEIAKAHKRSRVVAIEINAAACGYAEENARLNKTPNVKVEKGNVSSFTSKYAKFADRIVMPLPMSSSRFLSDALKMCSKKCTIHYYTFCRASETGKTITELTQHIRAKGRKPRILEHRVVRPYSATDIELVVDVSV